MKNNEILSFILIYVLIAIFTFLTFKFLIKNIIFVSLALPLFVLIVVYAFKPRYDSPLPLNKKSIRYTMRCKNCNWEWMSNTGDKAPNICPNCKEKEKLEIIGWRQILVQGKKSNIDLRNFMDNE